MRHGNHRHQLGVKKEHRQALMANLAVALFQHGRIQTTLAKAKALRPFAEKIITLACKAAAAEDKADKLHYRRQAIARIRDSKVVAKLFDERADEFANRPGGYTRIYKLMPRLGDAAAMGLIELIDASDEGYKKSKGKPAKKKATKPAPRAKATSDTSEANAEGEKKPAAKKKATTKKATTKKATSTAAKKKTAKKEEE